ncbi:MAG: hypothetical protein KatS3mg110_1459 [Pirellulaceae bacterium]|nr:MAG: hypothetical protein KatS3mg110_1456 [Pirellulaceae bacterium]GIW93418.1 MAG: hypothetical protein KatS3mg110_1459 [Pirellulaceae bacterium]
MAGSPQVKDSALALALAMKAPEDAVWHMGKEVALVFTVGMLMDRTRPAALRFASTIVFQAGVCLDAISHADLVSQYGKTGTVILWFGCLSSSLASLTARLRCLLELFIALVVNDCIRTIEHFHRIVLLCLWTVDSRVMS